jgi:hypothetical protein
MGQELIASQKLGSMGIIDCMDLAEGALLSFKIHSLTQSGY